MMKPGTEVITLDGRKIVGKEPCPQCRSEGRDKTGNNLHRYEDGHAFCFAGHGLVHKSNAQDLMERVVNKHHEEALKERQVVLPADASSAIAAKALTWLSKYEITKDEVKENELLWSDFREQLIFPFRDGKGNLLAYQARNFREPIGQAKSKWWSAGNLDDLTHIIDGPTAQPGASLVLVEDIISTIKVGRHMQTLCLFGSNLSVRRLLRLKYLANNVIFWLDADKFKSSLKFTKQLEMQGLAASVIYTEKDPKDYDDNQIISFLRA